MKTLCSVVLLFLLVLAANSSLSIPAAAQSGVTAEPSSIKIDAMRFPPSEVTRTLILSSPESAPGLTATTADLYAANHDVLPASSIHVAPGTLTGGQPLSVPVTVSIRNVRSGAYTGNLVLTYAGGSLNVPMEVSVKDFWALPLLVLILGLLLSYGISWYTALGRPRDQLIVRIADVRATMRADPPDHSFLDQIEGYFVEAEDQLTRQNWDKAQAAVEAGEAVWLRWRRQADDWRNQLDYLTRLNDRIKDLPGSKFRTWAASEIDTLWRDAPGKSGPAALRVALDTLYNRAAAFEAMAAALKEIGTLVNGVKDEATRQKYQRQAQDLNGRLLKVNPDEPEWQALEAEAKALRDAIEAQQFPALAAQRESAAAATGRTLGAPPQAPSTLPPPGQARSNLRNFAVLTAVAALLMLAWLGFVNLYSSDPAFGAAPIDYFTLFAWGFGIEATRASVVDFVRSWGLPLR